MAAVSARQGQVARAAGTVMAAFVLSRVLGLAREVAISSRFGTGAELDAYLAAFRIPDILFQLMAGGALASAFIPTFAGLLAAGDENEAWHLATSTINVLIAAVGAVSLLCALLAGPLVRYVVAPGFDPERQALTAGLMRVMLLAPVVFAVSGVFMGILNSHQRFLAAALAPSAYNLAIIAGAVLLAPRLGVYGLALGVAGGAVLHYVIQLPQVWRLLVGSGGAPTAGATAVGPIRLGRRALPAPPRRVRPALSPHLREVVRLMLPRTAGLAAVQANFLINTILASTLSPGSLAVINFAWILMLLPQGVFAQGIATAVFPTFSALVARRELEQMTELFLKSLRAVLFLALPAAVGLILLREPIVSLIYQRQAFGAASVVAVARVLGFYSIGLCAHSLLEVMTRAFYAAHDTRTPVLVGVLAMALNVVFSLILMRPLREAGLALANSIAIWLEVVVLWLLLGRRLPDLALARLAPDTAMIATAGTALAVVLTLLLLFTTLPPAATALLGVGLGGAAYLGVAAALGVPEGRRALQEARRLAMAVSRKGA